MKIIKVVHSDTKEEIETEKALCTLQSYSVDTFIEKYGQSLEELAYTTLTVKSMHGLIQSFADEAAIKAVIGSIIQRTASSFLQELYEQFKNLEILSMEEAQEKYPKTLNLSIGTYTQHPRNNQMLTPLEHYHYNLALEKDNELIVLLGKMGARTIKILESRSKDREQTFKGNLNTAKAIFDAEASMNIAQKIGRGRELEVTFEGQYVDIDPDLLEKSLWFSRDDKLNSIFESRRFSQNKMKSYLLKNTYNETFDFDFDLAVKYLAVKVDLKAEYNSICNKERFFYVEFGE